MITNVYALGNLIVPTDTVNTTIGIRTVVFDPTQGIFVRLIHLLCIQSTYVFLLLSSSALFPLQVFSSTIALSRYVVFAIIKILVSWFSFFFIFSLLLSFLFYFSLLIEYAAGVGTAVPERINIFRIQKLKQIGKYS